MNIQINGLYHRYARSEKMLFSGLEAHFSCGRIHGIFGDNGTGKTTLLRLISGLEPLQNGSITLGGEAISRKRIRDEGIVYVSSKPVLLSGTVLENAEVGLLSRGMSQLEAHKTVRPFLEHLDLWRLAGQDAKTLSSGEGQKLAFVRALAINPKVLMVDEPTGNVDYSMTLAVEDLIRTCVKRNQTTVLLISHDFEQLKRVCHTMWRLSPDALKRLDLINTLEGLDFT
jgi:ABC-type multidrug transport system ATPase subunit